jgi:asparagine synthase (glutamine-hydrolysing)
MCGILFTNIDNIDKSRFIHALEQISHRGPDRPLCYYNYDQFQLGHNRLSILDINDRSNQPYFSRDGRYVIIFNGEIYNYRELAKKHSIHTKTTSDTEVLLELYIKYGNQMLEWLNGMFSFVILDTEKKEIFAARDRLGVKPLYYYHDGEGYVFASEISPIIELINAVSIDEIGVRQYRKLRSFFNGRTIYNEVKEFPPGHYMENGRFHCYWKLEMGYQESPSDEELRELIESAVKYRMISDVNVGSYLSGGLDSTIVAGLARVEHTWTVGFNDVNEFEWSSIAAEKYNTIHHKVVIDSEEFLTLTREMINRTKEPVAVPNEVLIYKMTGEVKKYNKVILSGEGADELFYGYDRIFRWANETNKWNVSEFSRYYSYGSENDLEIVEDAIAPYLIHKEPILIVASFFQTAHLRGLLKRLDRATMLCGVEARSPFLDYRLVERLAGVDFNYKIHDGVVKAPLKRIFKDLVPNEIIERKKVGFPVPLEKVLPIQLSGETYMDKWFNYNLMVLMEEI